MALVQRLSSAAIGLALLVTGGVEAANAAAEICRGLEAQLVALNRGGGGPGQSSLVQYDQTLSQQRQEYDRAMAEARRANCMGGFLFFPSNPQPKCGALMATIDRMKANLERLTSARNRIAGDPFTIGQRRTELLRALADNQCGDQYAAYGRSAPPRPGGLFATLFGGPRYGDIWQPPDNAYPPMGPSIGTYRTLCVRTCDGYYFPISFSTVPSEFSADQQTCQSMCPGAEVALYTHRNPGEESESMVSLSGEPYTALPTAFKYRQQYDATCTCHAATTAALGGYALTGTIEPTVNATPVNPDVYASLVPEPPPRPSFSEDPETLADRAGDFVPRPVGPANSASVAGTLIQSNGKTVRVVGPQYYIAE